MRSPTHEPRAAVRDAGPRAPGLGCVTADDATIALRQPSVRVTLTVASLAREHGGPSRSVPALCEALIAAGAVAEVLTPAAERSFRADLRANVRARDVGVLHDNGVWLAANHAVAATARALRVPRVVSPRGMLEPWSLRHRAWKKKLAWWGYQHRDLRGAALIHATSAMEADNLRALGMRQPVAVIANGVDVPPLEYERARGDERVAVFLSRMHPKKGLLNLVQAWSAVRPAGWRMVVAGPDEGGHAAEVAAAVRAARLESCFTLMGAVEGEEKLALLQRGDLFVFPTYSENFGLVVAEALANGLPVITTKGAPWAELESERCGWWIDVGAEPLVAALRQATALSDVERNAMGARGREWVRRRFAWPNIGREMLAVYEWVLDRGTAPASVRHD